MRIFSLEWYLVIKMIYCNDELHQYFTEEELEQTAKELIVMENEPEKYKSYSNVQELFDDLDS